MHIDEIETPAAPIGSVILGRNLRRMAEYRSELSPFRVACSVTAAVAPSMRRGNAVQSHRLSSEARGFQISVNNLLKTACYAPAGKNA